MHPDIPTPRPARRRDPVARWAGCVSRIGVVVTVAGTLAVVGCRQLSKVVGPKEKPDLLEAELRTREREILELRAENQQLKSLTDIYQRHNCPDPHAVIPGPVYGPAPASPTGGVILRDVSLGSGTGGRDDDGLPGDETLQVVIVPKDDDGTAVKVPGRATVTAAEVSREGLKVPIGQWEVTAEQLKKTWRGGLLGSGYFVPLQWDRPPTTDRVRVTIRFATADGRNYEADKDVTVRPLPGLAPRGGVPPEPPSPAGAVLPPPPFPTDSNLLPAPRVIDDAPARLRPAVPK